MGLFRGILSFPQLFTPKAIQGIVDSKPRYSGALLFPPGDPELAKAQAEFQAALTATFPSGLPRTADVCLMTYQEKYAGKAYYDPKLADWWVLSFTSPETSKPTVVDANYTPVIDPGKVFPGQIVYVHANIAGYLTGKSGVGCFVNGVMTTDEIGQLGRLDNKPTAEQMFSGVGQAPATTAAAAPPPTAPPAMPTPPTPPSAPPAAPSGPAMTAKANGTTYEQFRAAGWTDLQLVEQGYMEAPVATSF